MTSRSYIPNPRKSRSMTNEECKRAILALHAAHGAKALVTSWLTENGQGELMRRANRLQMHFGHIADELGCREEMLEAKRAMCRESHSKKMSSTESINCVKALYEREGLEVFSWNWLRDHGYSNVVKRCRRNKMSPDDVARACGVDPSPLAAQRRINSVETCGRTSWTEGTVWQAIDEVINEHNGSMPSWDWLRLNGSAPMLYAMHRFGISTATVEKERPGAYHHTRLTCRQGLKWDSYPETMLSNFFYGRGFDVHNGSRYPPEYAAFSGRSSGRYDMHIIASEAPNRGKRLLIEIWGGGQTCNREEYEKTRKLKEAFHAGNTLFVGIDFMDCYSEDVLKARFAPFIGLPGVVRVAREADRCVPSIHWTMADEVVDKCRTICDNMDDKRLPALAWFTKAGRFKGRDVFPWEADLYRSSATFGSQCTMIGMNNLRKILKQDTTCTQWSIQTAEECIKSFASSHSNCPTITTDRLRALKKRDADQEALLQDSRRAQNAKQWLARVRRRQAQAQAEAQAPTDLGVDPGH